MTGDSLTKFIARKSRAASTWIRESIQDFWSHFVATGVCTPHFAKAVLFPSLILGGIIVLETWLSPVVGSGRGLTYLYFVPLWLAARKGGPIAGTVIVVLTSVALLNTTHEAGNPLGWLIHVCALFAILRLFTSTEKDFSAAKHAALSDSLTGLMNRRAFSARVPAAVRETLKCGDAASLLVIDCDKFKQINDVYGHAMGDQALIAVSKALREVMQDGDLVGRLGGDEFVVFLHQCDRIGANIYAAKVRRALDGLSQILPFELSVSVGIAFVGEDGITLSHLLAAADDKMFRQKRMNHDLQMSFAEIEYLDSASSLRHRSRLS